MLAEYERRGEIASRPRSEESRRSGTEPVPPLRFAQLVGGVFAVLGFVGVVAGCPRGGAALARLAALAGVGKAG
ncbi:DUF4395 family protein, partial [Nocardia wallacei]|uniref:DUF4395 family protein n=1 Tax=Nocardia wallacei TaxID=480035 RepID=UPI003CC80248